MNLRLVSELVPHWAGRTPKAIALSEAVRSWTYAELNQAIRAATTTLEKAGVRPGDRVLLVCENGSAAIALYFACTTLRAWPVIVNARLSDREIGDIRRHCHPRLAAFTTEGSIHALRHAQKDHAVDAGIATLPGIVLGSVDHESVCEPAEGNSGNEVAALIYTSGTTGEPKGVMLSHKNLLFAALGAAKVRRLAPSDRVLSVLPISHILGLSGVLLGSFANGAEVQLLTRFDPASLLGKIENAGTTILIGTPAMYSMTAEYAARKNLSRLSAHGLRIISAAGAPLDAATKANAEALFGRPLRNGYGITECSPTITLGDIDAPCPDLSVGRALPGIETRIVGASGSDVAIGEVGELWVRGRGVMKGYYRAQEETARAIDVDGWFRTGDLVQCVDGNFTIVGRSKEMLIRFGYNVYPAEVEAVLNAHPKIACSAVLGSAIEAGDEIAAFVELRGGETLRKCELAEYAASRLAPYKRPSVWIVVDKLPLTPAGKVLKSALAARLAQAS